MERTFFPDDLVQAQREWTATYRALAVSGAQGSTVLRRRLLRLSVMIRWHPFWRHAPGAGPAARVELRRRARAEDKLG